MDEKRHPGITMHKLPVDGGFMGVLFAAGSALIFLLGFPTLWYFVAFAVVLGVGVAIFLRFVNRYRSQRNKPLSILVNQENPEPKLSPEREKRPDFRCSLQKFSPV
jgi:hypothetical protein